MQGCANGRLEILPNKQSSLSSEAFSTQAKGGETNIFPISHSPAFLFHKHFPPPAGVCFSFPAPLFRLPSFPRHKPTLFPFYVSKTGRSCPIGHPPHLCPSYEHILAICRLEYLMPPYTPSMGQQQRLHAIKSPVTTSQYAFSKP